jgi:hypothetical protein
MNNIVKFGNPGLIDTRVWSTFGVSAKVGDNPIGQFGTGLKYAIAVLVREGRHISIKRGDEDFVFASEKAEIRGEEFNQIMCNGEPMPYTTHLGYKWELWQAYRELYSNCIDEGGCIGDSGDTVISAEIGDVDHHEVFLETSNRRIVASSAYCDIYAGASPWIYNKGIRAGECRKPSLFTYNIKIADLTEDRTFKYTYDVHKGISHTVLDSDSDDLLYPFIMQSKNNYEADIDFSYAGNEPSQRILDIVSQYRRDDVYLQESIFSAAVKRLGAEPIKYFEPDDYQSSVITKAKDFCEKIGYPIKYPIYVSDTLGANKLAIADRKSNSIYLSDTVITQGSKQVAATLIEENLHLAKLLDDCTYGMQTYLFDQIVTMGEKLTGEVL